MLKRNKKSKNVVLYEHGIGLEPSSKAVIGSQEVPYIYEDRLAGTDVIKALEMFYNLSTEERKTLGTAGREHVMKNYNFDEFQSRWDEIMTSVHEKNGSWDNRKGYAGYTFKEIV